MYVEQTLRKFLNHMDNTVTVLNTPGMFPEFLIKTKVFNAGAEQGKDSFNRVLTEKLRFKF